MLIKLSNAFAKMAKFSLITAEIAMFIFVGFGFCRVWENGVNGPSSLILSSCMFLTLLSIVFYFASYVCKIKVGGVKNKDKVKIDDF